MNMAMATPAARRTRPQIAVLQSISPPTPTTNPYLVQLFASLPQSVRVSFWSLPRALLSRYDVLHVHWPEYMLRHPTRLGTLFKQLGVALLLLRLWATRTPVVRTLHNLAPHEDGSARERLLLAWLDRLTARWIRINAITPERAPATDTILHGHYRDWFAPLRADGVMQGRLLHFGLIRPYKGVETLIAALRGLPDADVSLRIVGNPSTAQMREQVRQACAEDARISALLQYAEDPLLAREIGQAELVVLPYRQMHNSGTLLLALSLARPVLAPWSEANAAVAAEVGEGWVILYRGELDASTLADALRRVRQSSRTAEPDLSRREWDAQGEQHYQAYLAALGLVQREAVR